MHANWWRANLSWSDVDSFCAVRHLHQHADDRKFKYDSLSTPGRSCNAGLEEKGAINIVEG